MTIPIKRIRETWDALREMKAATISELRFHLGFKYRIEELIPCLRLLRELGLVERLGRLWRVKRGVSAA